VARREIGLEMNADNIKYMVMSRDQNAGRSYSMKTERVEKFKYLEITLKYQNFIQEEIKSRLKSRNTCYYLVRNLLSSSLLPKNLKIKIHRTIISLVVLHGCKTWSRILREQCRLRMFENGALRRLFGPKRDEVTREWRQLHIKELNDLYTSSNIIRMSKSRRMRLAEHVSSMGEKKGVYRDFWWGNLRERDYLEDPCVDGRIILRWISRK
jgi:hypothetical protein